MALIYEAELSPSKAELLGSWVPRRPWSGGLPVDDVVGSYRLDDPAGAVGIETHLVRAGERLLQVPLTYRGTPQAGLEPFLVAVLEHSVLGRRWVYDACGDPTAVAALATTILTGGGQAEVWVHRPDGPQRRAPSVRVAGGGMPGPVVTPPRVGDVAVTDRAGSTVVTTPEVELTVRRVLDGAFVAEGRPTLTGTWDGQAPTVLALARRR